MTKKLIFAFALFSLSAAGCSQSACEQAADQAEECGLTTTAAEIELCETFIDEATLQACVDCRDTAADSCTASDTGGPCEAACSN